MAKRSEIDELVATTSCSARMTPCAVFTVTTPLSSVTSSTGLSRKSHAALAVSLRDPGEIFQRMKVRLPWITQGVAVLTSLQWHAHQPWTGAPTSRTASISWPMISARHIPALKEIAVEPPEVVIDLFFILDFLDAVDGRGLAVAKELGRLLALDLRHFADEIVA